MPEIVLVIAILYLIFNYILASAASDASKNKGYSYSVSFFFFLSPLSYIVGAALPDLVLHQKLDKLIEKQLLDKNEIEPSVSQVEQPTEEIKHVYPHLPELD